VPSPDASVAGDFQPSLDVSQRIGANVLASATVNTVACRVPEPGKRIMLETHVDHVVRPRDFGVSDDRELGVALSWSFVDAPPGGAATVE